MPKQIVIVLAVQINVTPGKMAERDEIKRDLLENILAVVGQCGSDWDTVDYEVNDAQELNGDVEDR